VGRPDDGMVKAGAASRRRSSAWCSRSAWARSARRARAWSWARWVALR